MKTRILSSLAMLGLALGGHVAAQAVPNIGEAVQQNVQQSVQSTVERQVERAQNAVAEQAQNAAVERVVERAGEAANQAVERAQSAQAELVQNQTLEQVQNQVERVQAQAADQAQTQVERVQEQATGRAQATVERVQAQVENAQDHVEQVQAQVARLPEQAAERAQERVPEYVPAIVPQTAGGRAAEAVGAAAGTVAAAVPDDASRSTTEPGATPAADTGAVADPVRQAVNAADGSPAFVEITLPDGARAVEFEWVMIVTPEERARLANEATELLTYLTDTTPFALADDGELLTFTVPPDLDANDAILDLVPDNMRDLIDRNHIFETQDDDRHSAPPQGATQLTLPMPAVCTESVKLGMVDSSINTTHSAFAASGAVITQRSFVDADLPQATGHGTAVAALLVGRDGAADKRDSVLHPLLPAATLYSASVFHANAGAAQGATVMRILSALDWLLQQDDVKVINMSLAGPPNKLLARAVAAASEKGRVIVAAVGNDGPYGPVRYPAAYDGVVGVTAVARDSGIFRFANQGPHVDYAALGVEVPTARDTGGFGPESGTSLAAPIVAAFLACELAHSSDVHQALAALDARVRDLGAPGADPVYGRGLLHP